MEMVLFAGGVLLIAGCGFLIGHLLFRTKRIEHVEQEFLSIASHQLRTPLSNIKWYAEMLLHGDVGKTTKKQHAYLKEIYRSNERMIRLVTDLLQASRINLGKLAVSPRVIDVGAVMEQVIAGCRVRSKARGLRFEFVRPHSLPSCSTDPDLLHIIFENIIANAIEYTPQRGKITVTLTMQDDSFLAAVQDTGYGIPQDVKDRVFDKFFRAENVVEKDTDGTGLGLYIVKSLADLLHGKVWFESEEHRGTTFYVLIPCAILKATQ